MLRAHEVLEHQGLLKTEVVNSKVPKLETITLYKLANSVLIQ